jgi:hypothetical protein
MSRHFALRSLMMSPMLLVALSARNHAMGQPDTIEIVARPAGQHGGDERLPPSKPITVNLPSARLFKMKIADQQYGQANLYKVISVEKLAEMHPAYDKSDLALLHFVNGMAVPVQLHSSEGRRVFVAASIWDSEKGTFVRSFPSVTKKDAVYADRRPIGFSGNKVVVEGDTASGEAFNPWPYVDSLSEIELAKSEPYYQQFATPGSEREFRGLTVYKRACQFCHGTRGIGARFGWDFVEPYPVYQYRKTAKSLFYHIQYRVADASERGYMMPAIQNLNESQVTDLWYWLQAIAKNPNRPYAP